MSFLLKFIDELAEEEDDELIEVLKNEYGHFLFLAMIFPRWKKPLASFGLVLFYLSTIVLHHAMLSYAVYLSLLEHNWEQVSFLTHLVILLSFAIFQPVNFNWVRRVVAHVHRTLAKDVGIYCSGRIYDDPVCIAFREKIRLEKKFYMTMSAFCLMMGGILWSGLYISKSFSDIEQSYSSSGLSLKLPLALYYPFPTDRGVLHYVILGSQLLVCLVIGFLYLICEVLLINLFLKIKYELQVIGYAIDSLVSRSINAVGVNENNQQKDILVIEDTKLQRSVEKCLKETIVHYQKILGLLLIARANLDAPLAIVMMLGLLVIGISLLNMLAALKANYIGMFLTFGMLVCAEIQAQLLVCLLGSSITEQADILREKLYSIEWYCFDMKNRRILLNFQACFTKSFVVTAGGIAEINMVTFSWILRAAYRFFNLMRSTS
ncbi:hypothetical protein GE061_009191 [Apolygus lucorum]|uniref:Odorant receptor n=1 Tax=Apolygus lucorum TaxID=248454 RepID=A0A8S9Y1L0_APOLU|nr:hypothetical protein GE061_009191 [Apolygus lucorum]